MPLVDELERLQALRASNALSESEYEAAKAILLDQAGPAKEFSNSIWDDPRFLTALIWGVVVFVMVFGVFQISWLGCAGILLFLAITGVAVGLGVHGTRRVWARVQLAPLSKMPTETEAFRH